MKFTKIIQYSGEGAGVRRKTGYWEGVAVGNGEEDQWTGKKQEVLEMTKQGWEY